MTTEPRQNIEGEKWQQSFFEAATDFDEGVPHHGAFSILPPPPEAAPAEDGFELDVAHGIDLMLGGHYAAAVVVFRTALDLREDSSVRARLIRLGELGYE